MSTIGARVRAARKAQRQTLRGLAGDRLSISLISKIERDLVRPSLPTLEYLASRLGVAVAALVEAGRSGATDGARLARGAAALALGDPAAALSAAEGVASVEATAIRAEALLALGRLPEAMREIEAPRPVDGRAPAVDARLDLVRAQILSQRGRDDAAQEAFASALRRLPDDEPALRADALEGMARLAERGRQLATARSLHAQAVAALAVAASPTRRIETLRRRAEEAAGDVDATRGLHRAIDELAALGRSAARHADSAARLAELELAAGRPDEALRLYREAGESMRQRDVRRPRAN